MIGKLKGRIEDIHKGHCVVDVGGVGYNVYCGTRLLQNLSIGKDITFYIETIVREMQISLFGFMTSDEVEWFKILQEVQGIGAKAALLVVDSDDTDDILSAVLNNNKDFFTKISGIGDKVATRIVNELSGKKQIKELIKNRNILSNDKNIEHVTDSSTDEAILALLELGFNKSDIIRVLQSATEGLSSEQLVRYALSVLYK